MGNVSLDPSGQTYTQSGGYAAVSPKRFDLQYTLTGHTLTVNTQALGNQDVPSVPTMEYWPSVNPPGSLTPWPVEWRFYGGPTPHELLLVASGQFVPNTPVTYTYNSFPNNQNYLFAQAVLTFPGGYSEATPVVKIAQ